MEFLSDEWFDAMASAVAAVEAPPELELRIGQVVTGAEGGDVSYALECSGGRCSLVRGPADDADVIFRSSVDVARRVAAGEGGPPGHAVLAGDIEVTGDVTRLLGTADLVARLRAAMAAAELGA